MIKVGFIGAGDIAYLHGEGVSSSANAELTGIWNRTRSKAEAKAKAEPAKLAHEIAVFHEWDVDGNGSDRGGGGSGV